MNTISLLIVEDDEQVSRFLNERLTRAGYTAQTATAGRTALAIAEGAIFDLVLIDIHLPDMLGVELLEALRRRDPDLDIVIMTGYPEVETAVQALRLGASDYLIKPLEWAPLQHSINRIVERRYLRREVASLRSRLASTPAVSDLIGCSKRIEQMKDTIAKVAPSDAAVLIVGESGTGKELIARAIHRLSGRSTGPFVPINCAAIPAELVETELFGHQKGAFSGATAESRGLFRSADGGTLLLDEIGELPVQLQPKLLRVLQEKKVRPVGGSHAHSVDVRIIAATNQDLESAVQARRFRRDLYFRLNVVRFEPPPLREIREDIPVLATHFIRQLNRKFGRNITSIAPPVMEALMAYDFPGNVRELENILERAYALGAIGEIKLDDLPRLTPECRNAGGPTLKISPHALDDLERDLIQAALDACENDKEKAAQALGFSERTLYRRLKKLGVS